MSPKDSSPNPNSIGDSSNVLLHSSIAEPDYMQEIEIETNGNHTTGGTAMNIDINNDVVVIEFPHAVSSQEDLALANLNYHRTKVIEQEEDLRALQLKLLLERETVSELQDTLTEIECELSDEIKALKEKLKTERVVQDSLSSSIGEMQNQHKAQVDVLEDLNGRLREALMNSTIFHKENTFKRMTAVHHDGLFLLTCISEYDKIVKHLRSELNHKNLKGCVHCGGSPKRTTPYSK